MPRKIIIANKRESSPDVHDYEFVLWLVVPLARRSYYANALLTSYLTGAETPTNSELNDLRNGVVKEEVHQAQWPTALGLSGIQSDLLDFYNQRQAYVNAYNPWVRYGSMWDGTSWTMKNVV